jgi:hypothetical protein
MAARDQIRRSPIVGGEENVEGGALADLGEVFSR